MRDTMHAINAWQVAAIKQAVQKANSKDAIFVEHDDVVAWLESWGGENEKNMPG